jgi:hypothetical protein
MDNAVVRFLPKKAPILPNRQPKFASHAQVRYQTKQDEFQTQQNGKLSQEQEAVVQKELKAFLKMHSDQAHLKRSQRPVTTQYLDRMEELAPQVKALRKAYADTKVLSSEQVKLIETVMELNKLLAEEAKGQARQKGMQSLSATSAVGGNNGNDPPTSKDDNDPQKQSPATPRTRWTVVKDAMKWYAKKGGLATDLILGTVLGALFAIGTPVMVATIPTTIGVLIGIQAIGWAYLACQDPNGEHINNLYKVYEQTEKGLAALRKKTSTSETTENEGNDTAEQTVSATL